jgi:hypothetical protein
MESTLTQQPALTADPVARYLSELATPKQIVELRNIIRERGISVDRLNPESETRFNARPEELTKEAHDSLRWLVEGGCIAPVAREPVDEDAGAYCAFGERPEVAL